VRRQWNPASAATVPIEIKRFIFGVASFKSALENTSRRFALQEAITCLLLVTEGPSCSQGAAKIVIDVESDCPYPAR